MPGLKSGLGVQGCQGRAGLLSDPMHSSPQESMGKEGKCVGWWAPGAPNNTFGTDPALASEEQGEGGEATCKKQKNSSGRIKVCTGD